MLTGRRAFKGDEISDVLAAVLRQEVDWSALPGRRRSACAGCSRAASTGIRGCGCGIELASRGQEVR
jgi:hypothetical protein